ncbi:MAG: cupin domain-containing protein [Alphaproteobacteria bacterium]|nr:MAG: cupin domain-containing protein [Alphaproteobacteria bacterium]
MELSTVPDSASLGLRSRFPVQWQIEAARRFKRCCESVWCFRRSTGTWEAIMQFRTSGLVLLGAMALPTCGLAQTTSNEKSAVAAANGILYQMSGSTEVVLDGGAKMLNAGDGLFIAGGKTATLAAGREGPSTFLHFLLASAGELGRPAETAPATVRELYRTASPIPGLKPGAYDLNLTRITFPAQMPLNPQHHRSGAALYFIISGSGANTVHGKTEARGPGSLIYEPYDLVHQWGNPGNEPLVFLAFNINPEGVAAVLPGAPAKDQ